MNLFPRGGKLERLFIDLSRADYIVLTWADEAVLRAPPRAMHHWLEIALLEAFVTMATQRQCCW